MHFQWLRVIWSKRQNMQGQTQQGLDPAQWQKRYRLAFLSWCCFQSVGKGPGIVSEPVALRSPASA